MKTDNDGVAMPMPARVLTCARCGTAFGCDLGGACWCMGEAFRLPMPEQGSGTDCLCPACLRALAASASARVS